MGMKQRCLNPKAKDYFRYGARGIKVCKRWLEFENFLADMGERPKGLTIERIDNNKGYSPYNCRWASYKEQNRNRKSNRHISYKGQTKLLIEWSEHLGISKDTLIYRLDTAKWSVTKTFNTPLISGGVPRSFFKHKGQSKSLKEWSEIYNIPYKNLHNRVYRGWSINKALTTPLKKVGQSD